jgi:hypothetical protein
MYGSVLDEENCFPIRRRWQEQIRCCGAQPPATIAAGKSE